MVTASSLEHRHTTLRTSILALHVVQVGGVVLALIVVPGQTPQIALTSNGCRPKRGTSPKPITLRVRNVRSNTANANDTATVSDASTLPSVLRNDGRSVAVSAPFSTVGTTGYRPWSEWGRRVEHGRQARGVGRLGTKGLDVRWNIAKGVMCAIEASIEATRSTGPASS